MIQDLHNLILSAGVCARRSIVIAIAAEAAVAAIAAATVRHGDPAGR